MEEKFVLSADNSWSQLDVLSLRLSSCNLNCKELNHLIQNSSHSVMGELAYSDNPILFYVYSSLGVSLWLSLIVNKPNTGQEL